MNKEEICFKLMELYYTNISLFKNCCMSLNNLFEKYNKMLEILVVGDEQMAKWKCEICGNEFENFHAQGFDNKIYCPLCFFKKENQDQKKHQKEVIDKTINAIDLVIELIKQQPTKDDRWILDRLNGFKIILEDKEVLE